MQFLFDNDVPDELSYVLRELGHAVTFLRQVLPSTSTDLSVMQYAVEGGHILVTCNRDDFVALARSHVHHGIIVLFRRNSRVAEGAALLRLLAKAGEQGLTGNITFA